MTQSFADPGIPQSGNSGATRTANVDLTANVSGYTSQMNSAAQSTGLLSAGVDQLSGKMAGLNKWAGKKLFHFAAADFGMLASATADAATFEKQLSTLAATASITGASMKGIKGGIESAFTKFPVARGQVVELVEAITNLGVTSASSIGSLTQTFIKLGAATGEPMTQLASGLIQLSRLMGSTDAGQIGNFANSLLTVSKNAGVSASGVLQFAQSIAPIARQAGIGEAAVLGISTAFSKAGADGFVATNTFNSMLSDITSSIATGSPELSKYANLIGVTSSQFAKMDKADAMVKILQAIGKQGPQAIAVLNSLGIQGTRAQSAIAAITQSGDLQKSINDALNAQSGQGNLNKGSKAAFDNLADSMTNVRNQFTQFGDEIGKTFLTPMTAAANLAASVARHLNSLVAPFAPIIAGMAGVAGMAAGAGSMALSAAGAIGAFALVRNVRNSKALGAFRGGMTVGGPREDLRAGSPIDRYTSGQMGRFERMMFTGGVGLRNQGSRVGMTPGQTSPFRDPQVLRNAMAAGPLAFMRGVSRMNENFLNGTSGPTVSSLPYAQRLNMWGEGLRGKTMLQAAAQEAKPLASQVGRTTFATTRLGAQLAGRVGQAAWAFAGPTVMGALVGGATGIPGGGRLANAGIRGLPTGGIADEWAGVKQAARNLGTAVGGIRSSIVPLRVGFAAAGNSAKDLAASLLRTSGTVLGAGVGQAVRGVGATIGMAARTVGTLGGMAMRAAFSLPGMLALMGGHALWAKGSADEAKGRDIAPLLNPIQQYNDKLGTTTSNLATFSQGLAGSASALAQLSTMTIAQATKFGDSDQSSAPRNPINKVWDAVVSAKDPVSLATSILSSMPIANGGQLKLAEQDMSAAGLNKKQVNQVISDYMAAGGPDAKSGLGKQTSISLQGAAAAAAEGHGGVAQHSVGTFAKIAESIPVLGTWIGYGSSEASTKLHPNPSQTSLALNANMISGIMSQQKTDVDTKGGAYADQRAMINLVHGIGPELNAAGAGGAYGERNQRALATALDQITGGGQDDYYKSMKNNRQLGPDMSATQQWAALTKTLRASKKGRQYLGNLAAERVNTSTDAGAQDQLINLANNTDGTDFNSKLKTFGALGKFSAGSSVIQSAIGIKQDDAGVQYDAAKSLEAMAEGGKKVTDGYAGAIARLSMFSAQVGDATGAMGKLIDRATAEEMVKQQALQPYQTHTENLTQAAQTRIQTATIYNQAKAQGLPTGSAEANMQKAKDNLDQLRASETAFDAQVVLTVQQFHTQQSRAEEDYLHQRKLQKDSFALQELYSLKDFQLQESRAIADHNRQLEDQAAQAAQSIYDPYTRVQAKYVLSGGEIEMDLNDQNARIRQQLDDMHKLEQQGLSKSAIQTLNLADPNNAAQAHELTASLKNDPKQIAKLNADAKARLALTAELTQSPENLAFEQSQKDYKLGLSRASHDFATQTERAVHQEGLSLTEMAHQFSLSNQRAAADLETSTQLISGSFDQVKKRAEAAAKSISTQAPVAAKNWADAFKGQTVLDVLGLADPNALVTAGTAAGKAVATGLKNGLAPNGGSTRDNSTHPAAGIPASYNPINIYLPHKAAGGIATKAQPVIFGEAGPEALIPLNQQGQNFMAGLIAKALGQAMVMVSGGGQSSSSTTVDSSTRYTGPITVVAQDTKIFEREMKAKARLKKLSSPVRH